MKGIILVGGSDIRLYPLTKVSHVWKKPHIPRYIWNANKHTRCSNNYGSYQFPKKLIPLIIDWYLEHEDWMNNVTSGAYQKHCYKMYKNR